MIPDEETFTAALESTAWVAALVARVAADGDAGLHAGMCSGYGNAIGKVRAWYAARRAQPGATAAGVPADEIVYLLHLMADGSGIWTDAIADAVSHLARVRTVFEWLRAEARKGLVAPMNPARPATNTAPWR